MAALVSSTSRELVMFTRSSLVLRNCNSVVLTSKRFIRGLRRRPVAVLYPNEKRETVLKPNRTFEQPKQRRADPESRRNQGHGEKTGAQKCSEPGSALRKPGVNTTKFSEGASSIREQLGGLRFERALPGDKRLAKLVSIARSKSFRDQQGKVLLEGRRLICDGLAAGATPQTLFFSRVERLQELPLDKLGQASLVKVKFEDIKIWSDLVTPQGVIAIFSKPHPSSLTFPKDIRLQSVPLFLICDNVRDPGSLGTVLRCAAAAGCDRVLLTQGCVDAWEPKVLRAAMGAHFRMPVFPGLDWDSILEHLPELASVHVADDGSTPMGRTGIEVQKAEGMEEYSESDSHEESDRESCLPRLGRKVYHDDWARGGTALVISGETHGPSSQALQLAEDTDGFRLVVPVAEGVQGLNSAMTASVLLFEGRKQLLKSLQRTGGNAKSGIRRHVAPLT